MGIIERLMGMVKVTPNGCFEWQGTRRSERSQYGVIYFEGKQWLVHRLSFEVFRKPIPKGLCVCHTCDNPCCINPAHLFLGTIRDNNHDCIRKGRNARGSKAGSSKLNEKQVIELCEDYSKPGADLGALAEKYGISKLGVLAITSGRYWKHIERPIVRIRNRLTAEQAMEVKRLFEQGEGIRPLARRLGLPRTTVRHIVRGETWKQLA